MSEVVIALALASGSALMQYQAGREAKKGYESKAKFKALEGRVEGVKAKEQGTEALRNARKLLANITATARSGGLEPNIGTPVDFGIFNIINPAFRDFQTAKDNQLFIRMQTNAQVEDLLRAGREAKAQGVANALGTLSAGIMNASRVGGPPADTNTPTSNTSNRFGSDSQRSRSSGSQTRFRSYPDGL
tara:strand:+ start:747 stop:1313 length:567 start_codon:yes stop_codon:yes gene_type:complete